MKLLFGQTANEALLASACVKPRKLLDAGFHFSQPNLDQALAAALRK
jgi:NAD dependent epimerase/dehydratase family enzyme